MEKNCVDYAKRNNIFVTIFYVKLGQRFSLKLGLTKQT